MLKRPVLLSFALTAAACSSGTSLPPPPAQGDEVSAAPEVAGSSAANPGPGQTQNPVNSEPLTGSGSAPSQQPPTVAPGVVLEGSEVPLLDAPTVPMPDQGDCDNILDVTYRDFTEDHADFEMPFGGDVVRLQLLEPTLDIEGKPVFLDSIGCPPDHMDPTVCGDWFPMEVSINSALSFDQWYRTVDGDNQEFNKQLTLTETPPSSGIYVYESAAFFPLEPTEGFGVSPRNHHMGENFLFTTEIHLLFTYVAGQTFSFRGDDDLWIFINDKLALDLGSMHNVESGTIDFDAQAAALGIAPRGQYSMDVFHAERHTSASNFRIETNIGCFRPAAPRVR